MLTRLADDVVSMKQDKKFGLFRATEVIGRGGMGEVWAGRHEERGTEVAIKVVTTARVVDEGYRDALASEVQAMASLSHPGIVTVLDYGHDDSDPELPFGSPYIVMERARQALVDIGREVDSWAMAAKPLVEILEALAHAHSHGLVHRDLKPHNVLEVEREGRYRWALTDFGLAAPVSELTSSAEARRVGTPRFMAPEQILGDIPEQGPWTDLYGFGCLAAWLVTGRPPFSGMSQTEILRGHIGEPIPPFQWRFGVPDGLDGWLRRLLAKDPLDRYRHAADALHGLRELGPVRTEDAPFAAFGDPISEVSDTDATLIDTAEPTRTTGSDDLDLTAGRSESDDFEPGISFDSEEWSRLRGTSVQHAPIRRPGLPNDWRVRRPDIPTELVGASLGLWGLREIPMVGREDARDRLWTALSEVHLTGEVRTVVVEGGPGTGKSRMVEWFAQRASECGGAEVLRARHSDRPGPIDGLAGMLARHMRVVGASPTDARVRIQHAMSDDGRGRAFDLLDVEALLSIVRNDSEGPVLLTSVEERVAVISRYLRRRAAQRPLILWLDDIQWGDEARVLLDHLARNRQIGPIVAVATLRSDLAAPSILALVETLSGDGELERIELEPLGESEHRTLVSQMLGLSGDLAELVVERTEGNPLFAVQLVGHWVSEGLLRVGADGFVLEADDIALPSSIRTLWAERLGRLLSTSQEREWALDTLEVAAALGVDVDYREWRQTCEVAGIATGLLPDLVRRLVQERLATSEDGGWSFGHGLFREAILEQARLPHGRLHRWCAEALGEIYGSSIVAGARIGRHRAMAGEVEKAFERLLPAAEHLARCGEFRAAIELDELALRTMDAAGWLEDDQRRLMARLRSARTLLLLGRLDEASETIADVLQFTDRTRGPLRAEALWCRSIESRHRSDPSGGLRYASEALEIYETLGDREGMARAHQKIGEFCRRLGEMERSIDNYQAAADIFHDLGTLFELAWSSLGLCATLRQLGENARALGHARLALDAFESLGSVVGIGNANNEIGEILRDGGRFAEAERHYERVIEVWSKSGHVEFDIIELNIALSLIGQRRWDDARQKLLDLIDRSRGEGAGRGLTLYALSALTAVGAATGDPEPAATFEKFRSFHDEVELVDLDLATNLELAARESADEGLRRDAAHFAIRQWEALGRRDRAAELEELLAASE